MHEIKDIIPDVLNQAGLDKGIEENKALMLWDDIVPTMASKTQAVSLSEGKMVVNVTDSVVLHALNIYKRRYIYKLNLLLGKPVVSEIVFRIGPINKRSHKSESNDDYLDKFRCIQLDEEQLRKIDEIVSLVEDKEIQNELKELFINQSKLSKIREENR
ncbi:MAG: DUF721 domain-containing protein [bacterium]